MADQIANLRKSAMTDVVRTYVAAESVEEQWDLPGLETVLRDEWQLRGRPAGRGRQERHHHRRRHRREGRRRRRCDVRRQGGAGRRGPVQSVHAHGAAAVDRLALARAPGGARLPAPGHPPARLRAEEPQAGIQARGVRAVRAAARSGQARSHAPADDGAHPVAGAGERGRAGDRGARQPGQQRDLHAPERGRQRVRRGRPRHARCSRVPKVGRNDPCPCGSGKKYKHCHGKLA